MAKSKAPTPPKAPKAKADAPKVTVKAGATFDAKANKAATEAERAARLAGDAVKTSEFTVRPGRSVRSGGVRYMEGEPVQLSAADGERLVALGAVAAGEAGAKAVDAEAAALAEKLAAEEQAATDKRLADEAQAAADEAARLLAAGQ